jgi:Tol biopolymer transport system component
MALRPGQRLGPYEIESALGAGGMGEVYRARDTRLGRIVAIKVLGAHLSDEPDLRERFEREAQAVANLHHPNICVLYDVGREADTDYIVIEYLDGETLAQRLTNGPLPLDQALEIGAQIADALDAAHRRGITHRDLKPANIMLTKSGAKLLDFGLAKLNAPVDGDVTTLSTIGATSSAGMLVGTIHYMAPEQLEGKPVDARTDIYAVGAIMQEMLTGKRAFEGIVPLAPPALDRAIKRCLAKDADNRWQSARDLAAELRWIANGDPATIAAGTGASGRRVAVVAAGALIAGAAVAGLAVWTLKPPPPARPSPTVTRMVIAVPPGDRLPIDQSQPVLALSPNGDQLAYVAVSDNTRRLYVRAMDSVQARVLPGTDGALAPFFSPDGQWIGFFADSKLQKVPVSGGTPVTVANGAGFLGSDWSPDGTILFVESPGVGLMEVPDSGGTPRLFVRSGVQAAAVAPQFLPDGRTVLFVTSTGPGSVGQLRAYSRETGTSRGLMTGAGFPKYVPSGHLVYAQGANLVAAPFDLNRLEIMGPAVPVVNGVALGDFTVSRTGSLAYIPAGGDAPRRLVWVTRNGDKTPLAAPARDYDFPQISPDGQRVAVEISSQVWLYDLSRDTLTRFAFDGSINDTPAWSPDGQRIAFRSNRAGRMNLFWQRADGGGGAERLTDNEYNDLPRSWTPDGRILAFQEVRPDTGRDIFTLRLGDRNPQPFLQTKYTEGCPQISPDGRWLAYVSDETGGPEVFVQPFPATGGKWQVSTDGGTEPVWNRNGHELFYRSGPKMMAVDVATQPAFSAGKPRMLFEGPYAASVFPLTGVAYDASPDGQRFLMMEEAGQPKPATEINVVVNWSEELKRRVPVKR